MIPSISTLLNLALPPYAHHKLWLALDRAVNGAASAVKRPCKGTPMNARKRAQKRAQQGSDKNA